MEFTTRLSCNPKQLDSSRAGRTTQSPRHRRDCHPPWCSVPRDFSPGRAWRRFCRLQFGAPSRRADSKCELIPLQSPLLGESPLVSFPPLNYMLKFGGSSCLIGGPSVRYALSRRASLRSHDAQEELDVPITDRAPPIEKARHRSWFECGA